MAYPKVIDMNRYEEVRDWTLEGYDGVILKTSEQNLVDKVYPSYMRSLKATTKVRGTYNYYRPVFDQYTQGKIYFDMARGTQLPPAIDVELWEGYSDDLSFYTNKSQAIIRSTLKSYLDLVEGMFGRKPMIYTAPYFWNKYYGNVDWAKDYLLWVANYDVLTPMIPLGWEKWTFWQYTSHGTVPGIVGGVDLNYFNGTITELKILSNVDPTIPPPPPPPEPRHTITILVDQLRVRIAPSAIAGIKDYLPKGICVDFTDTYTQGNDIWYQIGYKQWCAGIYNGYKYSEVTECS